MMRAILWCNGENPNLNMISKLLEGATLFGVDGGADKAIAAGFEVTEVWNEHYKICKKKLREICY